MIKISYSGYRFPPDIIQHAIWLKNPDKRAVISWLGGGALVGAGGTWTVVTFVLGATPA